MNDADKAMRGYLASEFYAATRTEAERPAPASTEPGKPVVAGVDGSRSALEAVVWAAREADRRGLPLRLVHACQLPGLDELLPGTEGAAAGDRVGTWLAEATAAAEAAVPGLKTTHEVHQGSAVKALVEESEHAAVLVVGSLGLSAFGRLLAGSVSTAVSARAHCPVVMVRRVPDPDGPVVVGMDCLPESEAAVSYAFDYATATGAPVTAVRAWRDPFMDDAWAGIPSVIDLETIEADERKALDRYLGLWRERYPGVEVTPLVLRSGRPSDAVLKAGKNARLIVVGSHGRGLLTGALLGSTSRAVLHRAGCPVAVIRSQPAVVPQ